MSPASTVPAVRSPPRTPRAEVRRRVHAAVARALGRPASSIDDDQRFLTDLEVDSIAVLDILCALEDELGLEIDEIDAFPVSTVGELVDLLADSLPRAAAPVRPGL